MMRQCRVGYRLSRCVVLLGVAVCGCRAEPLAGLREWHEEASQAAAQSPQHALPALAELPAIAEPGQLGGELPDPFFVGRGTPPRTAPAPAARQTAPPRGALTATSPDEIQLIGTLRRGARSVALLLVGNAVHHVEPGHSVGGDRWVVSAIHDDVVELRQVAGEQGGGLPATYRLTMVDGAP
ncbi:MAG: hypothetical protein KGL61_03265 [Burkholderiales bacterium]|nr:hypothetical protein [Burkholderiales bacterium]